MYRVLAAWLVCLIVTALIVRRARSTRRMYLVSDASGNEALVVNTIFAGTPGLFLVDTAYAGAPVLSTSYLAAHAHERTGSVQDRYRAVVDALRSSVDDASRFAALNDLLTRRVCRSFTSGCTMRLMGIGATQEAQADMLLCPALVIDPPRAPEMINGVQGDIFVTHPLPHSVHILTCDYLLHHSPAILLPAAQELRLHAMADPLLLQSFEYHTARFVGGAFVVPFYVAGAQLQIVIDTGAAAALSLGRSVRSRLTSAVQPTPPRHATQGGVHGERVCCDVLEASVQVGSLKVPKVEVFINAQEVEGADGYAGIGLLRAFDLWLEPNRIGFRFSGLQPRHSNLTRPGSC